MEGKDHALNAEKCLCWGSELLKFVFTIVMSIVPFVSFAAYVEIFDLLAPLGVLSFANVSPLVITMSNSFAISLMASENPKGSSRSAVTESLFAVGVHEPGEPVKNWSAKAPMETPWTDVLTERGFYTPDSDSSSEDDLIIG